MTNQGLIRRYYEEVFNQGRVEVLPELLADDYLNHSPGSPDQPRDRAGVAQVVRLLRAAFPDLHYRIEDIVSAPGAVAVRTTMTGTHRGDFFGTAPTGRRVSVGQICIEHIARGRIVAHHRLTDEAAMARQLSGK